MNIWEALAVAIAIVCFFRLSFMAIKYKKLYDDKNKKQITSEKPIVDVENELRTTIEKNLPKSPQGTRWQVKRILRDYSKFNRDYVYISDDVRVYRDSIKTEDDKEVCFQLILITGLKEHESEVVPIDKSVEIFAKDIVSRASNCIRRYHEEVKANSDWEGVYPNE